MASDTADYHNVESPRPESASTTERPWRDVPNPMGTANWFVDALILWLEPLMFRGAKKTLMEEDVWKLAPEDSSARLHARFDVFWKEEMAKPSPSVARAIMRTIRAKWYYTVSIYVVYAAVMLVQPSVIKSLLQYLQTRDGDEVHTTRGISSGYGLATLLTSLSFASVTLIDYGQYLSSNLGVNAKTIIMDSVYLKALKLSGFAKRSMTSGEIVTLTSVDSERLFQGFLTGPWVLVAPFNVAAIFVLIGFNLGYVVGLSGGVVMAALLYIGFNTSTRIVSYRRELLAVQSNRVKLTNEILQGINLREQELAILQKYQNIRVFNTVMLTVAPILSLAICLAVYTAQGNNLTPSLAFTALAYMNVARLSCTVFSTILLAHEIDDTKRIQAGETEMIEIHDGNFSWHVDPHNPQDNEDSVATPLTLNNINLNITPKSLTIIVGSVGSGKSSLINAILGEIQQVNGTRHVAGRISYVAQEAWIQHASLKDNILFADEYDEARFDRILTACQLKTDLAILPEGDATEIGERGINLSGGQ
ncbi:unnamed protein product [Aphanomyces euteiches]